ncbi:MAG: hypothetical protein Kow00105_00820 [Phycisphaeraceae bacterium]
MAGGKTGLIGQVKSGQGKGPKTLAAKGLNLYTSRSVGTLWLRAGTSDTSGLKPVSRFLLLQRVPRTML